MPPEFMPVEIAYQGVTLPAVTYALELMDNVPHPRSARPPGSTPPPSTSWPQ